MLDILEPNNLDLIGSSKLFEDQDRLQSKEYQSRSQSKSLYSVPRLTFKEFGLAIVRTVSQLR